MNDYRAGFMPCDGSFHMTLMDLGVFDLRLDGVTEKDLEAVMRGLGYAYQKKEGA